MSEHEVIHHCWGFFVCDSQSTQFYYLIAGWLVWCSVITGGVPQNECAPCSNPYKNYWLKKNHSLGPLHLVICQVFFAPLPFNERFKAKRGEKEKKNSQTCHWYFVTRIYNFWTVEQRNSNKLALKNQLIAPLWWQKTTNPFLL